MGGTALGFEAVRLDFSEHRAVFDSIMDGLSNSYPEHTKNADMIISLVPSYRDKSSFGDVDTILCAPAEVFSDIRDNTGDIFPDWSGDIFVNRDTISIGIDTPKGTAQVDIIYTGTRSRDAHTAYDYFAYNELGHLLGRIANSIGFKYGQGGLSYKLRKENTEAVIGEYFFKMEYFEILAFLGFDRAPGHNGFDTLEDIFKFVSTSIYFSPSIFSLDKMTAQRRARLGKRPNYIRFLGWLEATTKNENILREGDAEKLRAFKLNSMMWANSEFSNWVNTTRFTRSTAELASVYWNGTIVAHRLSIKTGPELGAFLREFRAHIEDENIITLEEWIVGMGHSSIDYTEIYYNRKR